MKIRYFHASKFGNGARVAEEFRKQMSAKGITVDINHIKDIKLKDIPAADLYVFSAPGRFGKPIGDMRNFLKKAYFKPGTLCVVITTEICAEPAKLKQPTAGDEADKHQRVLPIMNQILKEKGLVNIAESQIFVTGLKGPLEEGWQQKVNEIIPRIIKSANIVQDKEYTLANA